jgi:hypothetical protein
MKKYKKADPSNEYIQIQHLQQSQPRRDPCCNLRASALHKPACSPERDSRKEAAAIYNRILDLKAKNLKFISKMNNLLPVKSAIKHHSPSSRLGTPEIRKPSPYFKGHRSYSHTIELSDSLDGGGKLFKTQQRIMSELPDRLLSTNPKQPSQKEHISGANKLLKQMLLPQKNNPTFDELLRKANKLKTEAKCSRTFSSPSQEDRGGGDKRHARTVSQKLEFESFDQTITKMPKDKLVELKSAIDRRIKKLSKFGGLQEDWTKDNKFELRIRLEDRKFERQNGHLQDWGKAKSKGKAGQESKGPVAALKIKEEKEPESDDYSDILISSPSEIEIKSFIVNYYEKKQGD